MLITLMTLSITHQTKACLFAAWLVTNWRNVWTGNTATTNGGTLTVDNSNLRSGIILGGGSRGQHWPLFRQSDGDFPPWRIVDASVEMTLIGHCRCGIAFCALHNPIGFDSDKNLMSRGSKASLVEACPNCGDHLRNPDFAGRINTREVGYENRNPWDNECRSHQKVGSYGR